MVAHRKHAHTQCMTRLDARCRELVLPPCAANMPHLLASGPGLTLPWVSASHTPFASSLPMADMTLMSSSGHSSRSRDRTRDRCVPRFLWMPEHSMQISAPRFRLAQSGSEGDGGHSMLVRVQPVKGAFRQGEDELLVTHSGCRSQHTERCHGYL